MGHRTVPRDPPRGGSAPRSAPAPQPSGASRSRPATGAPRADTTPASTLTPKQSWRYAGTSWTPAGSFQPPITERTRPCLRADDQEAEPRHRFRSVPAGCCRTRRRVSEESAASSPRRRRSCCGHIAARSPCPPGSGRPMPLMNPAALITTTASTRPMRMSAAVSHHQRLPAGLRARGEPAGPAREPALSLGGGIPHGASPRSCECIAVTATAAGCRGLTPAVADRAR